MRTAGIALSLVVALSGCSVALRRAAQASEVMAQGSLVCDGLSTHAALKTGRYFETNPMIYYQPSNQEQGLYFGSISALSLGLNRVAEPAFRQHGDVASVVRIVINGALLAVELDSIQNNRNWGVSTCGL